MATELDRRERAMAQVYRTIDRARGNWRLFQMIEGLFRILLVLSVSLVAVFLADNLLHFSEGVRLGCVLALLGTLAFMALRFLLHPLLRPISDEMAATHLESAFPVPPSISARSP